MRKMHTLPALAITSLIFFQACVPSSNERHDVILEIMNTWDGFIEAWENQDAAACAAFFADDGINIPNEFTANRGRNEIEAFYAFLFSMNQSSKYTHTTLSLSHSGSITVELAEFNVQWIRSDGTPWTYIARSINHWERNDNGKWEIKALLFNLPPPGE